MQQTATHLFELVSNSIVCTSTQKLQHKTASQYNVTVCLKYNHVAKYCKTKQQTCLRCGENHRADQCNVTDDKVNCCNCKGKHLATSTECSIYQEQEKRAKKLINQYVNPSSNKQTTTAPISHSNTDFPPLPAHYVLISSMKSSKFKRENGEIIEETTQRIVNTLQKKIEKLEKALARSQGKDDEMTVSDSESASEESEVQKFINKKKQQKKQQQKWQLHQRKQQRRKQQKKRKANVPRSPNTSLDLDSKQQRP
jgi:hypothetical protein